MHRHAVCVTGLEREYADIRANVRHAVLGLLRRTAPTVDVRWFGVRPPEDPWAHAVADLGFEAIERQTPCLAPNASLPMWFTCSRGSGTTRGGVCARSFVR